MRINSVYSLLAIALMQTLTCFDTFSQNFDPGSPVMLSGKWVPDDPREIDFDRLPGPPKSDHVIVHDVRDQDGRRVNQHNYLTFYEGLYWAMWSDGPGVVRRPPGMHRDVVPGHEQPRQKVAYATSKDGLKWSKAKDITDTPPAPDGWIARGFWVREGKLLALASLDDTADFFLAQILNYEAID